MATGQALRFEDREAVDRLVTKLLIIARYRYGIREPDADDVVQAALTTYLEVHPRYADVADHHSLLVGIFRKKCLEHIDRSVRERRRLERYCAKPDAARENAWIRPSAPGMTASVLDGITHAESRREIVEVLDSLRPSSKRIVELIVERNMGRPELLAHLNLKKNTLDSRLRACRLELLAKLQARSLA